MLERLTKRFKKEMKPKATRRTRTSQTANLAYSINRTNDHLIALARLVFVRPEVLVREARNVKANGEYLAKMISVLEKEARDSLSQTKEKNEN